MYTYIFIQLRVYIYTYIYINILACIYIRVRKHRKIFVTLDFGNKQMYTNSFLPHQEPSPKCKNIQFAILHVCASTLHFQETSALQTHNLAGVRCLVTCLHRVPPRKHMLRCEAGILRNSYWNLLVQWFAFFVSVLFCFVLFCTVQRFVFATPRLKQAGAERDWQRHTQTNRVRTATGRDRRRKTETT